MNTLIYNGKIQGTQQQFFESIYIKGNRIEALGTNLELEKYKTEATQVIDAQGQLVLPGLNDSHLHLLSLGNFLGSVNCYGLDSIQEIISKGKSYLEKKNFQENEAIIGMGWNQDYFKDEQRLLHRKDLDQISTQIPLIFKRACGHVLCCNTKALELLNITCETPQVDGGVFEMDQDGPTGIFNENAMQLVQPLMPKVDLQAVKETLKLAMNHAVAHGLTSVQTNDLMEADETAHLVIQAFQELEQENELLTRVYLQCCFKQPKHFQSFIEQGYSTGYGSNRFKIGPLKMFVDGSLGARTALMRQPYADDTSTSGVCCMTSEVLDEMVQLANDNNFQILVHAIGDGAIEEVLNSYEKIISPAQGNPLRHGINHCQITDLNLLHRFQERQILAFVQPIFLHYDIHIVEDRVGADLASTSYAFRTMEKLGIPIVYGTDAPVEDLNPFECMYCAVNRQDLSGYPSQGFHPQEKVSIESALHHYTQGGAYASFDEHEKGTLEKGKLADLIIVDQDLFTIDPASIKNTTVSLTMVDGQIVYEQQR